MDVYRAFYRTCHAYAPGLAALARECGLNAHTLSSKANPNHPAQPTLGDAMLVQKATGMHDVLHAMAGELGYLAVPTGRFDGASDAALLEIVARFGAEFGDVLQAVNAAVADSKVSEKEIEKVRTQLYEQQQAGAELLRRLEGMVR